MKASYRKNATGYYPVIIFNDKSRMTHRVHCLTKNMAIILAEKVIQDLKQQIENPLTNTESLVS